MERAVPSVKWKTTASAACIPRRDSTSPYSMAATVFPTASRTVCSLCSGLGGPIILGCSPLLACWLSIRAPSASCGRPLPSDTAHLTLAWLCPPSWDRQAPSSSLQARGGGWGSLLVTVCPVCGLRVASGPALRLRLPLSNQLFAAVLVLREGLAAHPLNVARGEFDRDAVRVLSSGKLDRPIWQSAACLFTGHSFAPSIREGYPRLTGSTPGRRQPRSSGRDSRLRLPKLGCRRAAGRTPRRTLPYHPAHPGR